MGNAVKLMGDAFKEWLIANWRNYSNRFMLSCFINKLLNPWFSLLAIEWQTICAVQFLLGDGRGIKKTSTPIRSLAIHGVRWCAPPHAGLHSLLSSLPGMGLKVVLVSCLLFWIFSLRWPQERKTQLFPTPDTPQCIWCLEHCAWRVGHSVLLWMSASCGMKLGW